MPPVVGTSSTANVSGVKGENTASAVDAIGVEGVCATGAGVLGKSTSGNGVLGVSVDGIAVNGRSTSEVGVQGESSSDVGVVGASGPAGVGVVGTAGAVIFSREGQGVLGVSQQGHGVRGESNVGTRSGVSGINHGGGVGVLGETGGASPAIRGENTTGNGPGIFGTTKQAASAILGSTSGTGNGVLGQSVGGSGVTGQSDSSDRASVFGVKGPGVGGPAVLGQGDTGPGVQGTSTGDNAVFGKCTSPDDSGVYGENLDGGFGVAGRATGTRPAVFGDQRGNGIGVQGLAQSAAGVTGESTSGQGVSGVSRSNVGVQGTSTQNNGVAGQSASPNDSGVFGLNTASGFGVAGRTNGGLPAVFADQAGRGPGVQGNSQGGPGVLGDSKSTDGVFGRSPQEDFAGVFGESTGKGAGAWGVSSLGLSAVVGQIRSGTGHGVEGFSAAGDGMLGVSSAVTGHGVIGVNDNSASRGVGIFGGTASPAGAGVFGTNQGRGGLGGEFLGNVDVKGTIFSTGKAFRIDHPLDPANKYLYHSSVESSDMMTIYNGNVTTDGNGQATVQLPAYFEALNSDFRYQLTVVGQLAQAAIEREVEGNNFVIRTDRANVKVSWQVTGIRRDPYAEAHRLRAEQDKPESERGLYIDPKVYGEAEDKQIGLRPAALERMPMRLET